MPNYTLTSQNTCQLSSQFQEWTDVYGMTTNNPNGGSTSNGNLFTAHYVYGLVKTGQITELERQRILNVYAKNFYKPGLLCRTPVFPGEREAQDDAFGLMGAEALLSPKLRVLTRSIYEYGKISANGVDPTEQFQGAQTRVFWAIKFITLGRCRWVYNNLVPGKFNESAWLGRFPAFIAIMQMSLQEQINPFNWLYWACSSLYSAWFGDKNSNNGDCLMLHGAEAAKGYGPLTNWVCSQIHKGFKRKYGSIGGLMSAYFANPDHPLVELLKDVV